MFTKYRLLDGNLMQRRLDAALITAGIITLIVAAAVLCFIWAHPVV